MLLQMPIKGAKGHAIAAATWWSDPCLNQTFN